MVGKYSNLTEEGLWGGCPVIGLRPCGRVADIGCSFYSYRTDP